MAKSKLRIFELATEWILPFVAAHRTIEKSINPAFTFHMRCAECKKFDVGFVKSVNNKKVVIGMQCKTSGCGQTIKFVGGIDPDAEDFPIRLKGDRPTSALSFEGSKAKTPKAYYKDIVELLLGSE